MSEDTEMKGLASASALFAGESVRLPFVPAVLAGAVRARSEFVFGTREAEYGLYALENFVAELQQPALEDYLLMGFDGHGIASQALHYYMVCGPLAVFIQRSHGNPFVDEEISLGRIDGALALVEVLFRDVTAAGSAGKLPPGQRLVVVESDFSSSRWGWVAKDEALAAEGDADALLGALFSVKALLG